MSNNPDIYGEMLFALEYILQTTWYLGGQMSNSSVQTKLDGCFKPASSPTSEACIGGYITVMLKTT
jgi:hypothetical protein